MRTTKRTLTLACTLAVWVALGAVVSPAAEADGTYVALGDSVAAPLDSYVHVLFGLLGTPEGGGLDTLYNRARGGEDSTTLRTNGQLATAIADTLVDQADAVARPGAGGTIEFAVVSRAEVPQQPSSPRPLNLLAIGAIIAGRVFSLPHASKVGVISVVVVFACAIAYLVLPGMLNGILGKGCI